MDLLKYSKEDRNRILSIHDRTSVSVQDDIEIVKEWFKKQLHLPETPSKYLETPSKYLEPPCDKFIENFLIINKFEIEKTKEKLDMYYTIRTLIPEMFDKGINDPEIKNVRDQIYILPLPKLTKSLHRVVITKFKTKSSDNFNPWLAFIHAFNHIEVRLRKDCNASLIYVFDCDGLKSSHLVKCTPNLLKKISFVSQKVITNRLQEIHFINISTAIESFIGLCKTFLKPKIAGRIMIHSNVKALYAMIPQDILPTDFGGQEKSLDELNELWKLKFVEYTLMFREINNFRVNEELRTEKLKVSDLFGLEGNFRQLNVD